MQSRTILRTALVLGVTCVTTAAECDDEVGPQLPGVLIEVRMLSHSSNSERIHIMGPLENVNESNRLEPGQERLTMVRLDGERNVTFRAGRSIEPLLRQITCKSSPASAGIVALVTWVEVSDGMLICADGLIPV